VNTNEEDAMYAIVVSGLLLFPWALAIIIAVGSFRPVQARIIPGK
jgi:hypothetical protein